MMLQEARDGGELTDMEFVLDSGRRMRGHKAWLMARCEYLRGMLSSGMREGKTGVVRVRECGEGAFAALLEFIYTGRLGEACLGQEWAELWEAADVFGMEGMQERLLDGVVRGNVEENSSRAANAPSPHSLTLTTPVFPSRIPLDSIPRRYSHLAMSHTLCPRILLPLSSTNSISVSSPPALASSNIVRPAASMLSGRFPTPAHASSLSLQLDGAGLASAASARARRKTASAKDPVSHGRISDVNISSALFGHPVHRQAPRKKKCTCDAATKQHAVSCVRRLRNSSPAPPSSSRRCLLLGRESPGTADDCPSSTAPSPTVPAAKPEAATPSAPSMSMSMSRPAALVCSRLAVVPPAPLTFALFFQSSPALICRLGPQILPHQPLSVEITVGRHQFHQCFVWRRIR